MPRVAVFLQTGVLSPYPAALLAANAPSLPVILPRLRYEQEKKTLDAVAPPLFSELILTAGSVLMGIPYPPSLLTFFGAGVRYRIFFIQYVLSATSAASYKVDLPGAPFFCL